MPVFSILLEDDVLIRLKAFSGESRRDTSEIVAEAIRRYLGEDPARRTLDAPSLRVLYEELAAEDLALSEAGIGEYMAMVSDADRTTPV